MPSIELISISYSNFFPSELQSSMIMIGKDLDDLIIHGDDLRPAAVSGGLDTDPAGPTTFTTRPFVEPISTHLNNRPTLR